MHALLVDVWMDGCVGGWVHVSDGCGQMDEISGVG